MAKRDFSEKIIETMEKKIKAIENIDPDEFAKKDEYFELAICLAYMTLSKEKIIDKDIKNDDQIKRLNENVDRNEINKVFDPSFSKKMPIIIKTAINDNLWILDNIRDSIMHGSFDVDEDKKCFILNNTQENREFEAEIPFSWFIAYAKNNILNQKQLKEFDVKGYYFNKNKQDRKNFKVQKEIYNNILYKVKITGDKVNTKEVEETIRTLFDKYAQEEIDKNIIEQYRERIDSETYKYNEEYLVSYYIAEDKVLKDLQAKYPNNTITISTVNYRENIKALAKRQMPKDHHSYELMMKELNELAGKKGMILLNYTTNLIDKYEEGQLSFTSRKIFDAVSKSIEDIPLKSIIGVGIESTIHPELSLEKCMSYMMTTYTDYKVKQNMLSDMLGNNDVETDYEKYRLFAKNRDILRTLCINVYGITTLVINQETLYNDHFLNERPEKYVTSAYETQPYIDNAIKKRKLELEKLRILTRKFEQQNNYDRCQNNIGKARILTNIRELETEETKVNIELYKLAQAMDRLIVSRASYKQQEDKIKLEQAIKKLYDCYENAKTKDGKEKVSKAIGNMMNIYIAETSKYTYLRCTDMSQVIKIMRNSLSHIGRISISTSNKGETYIVLNDYDTDGQKSGQVVCKYEALRNIFTEPYQNKKTLGTQI